MFCIPEGFKYEKQVFIVTPKQPAYALIIFLVVLSTTLSAIIFGTIKHTLNRCRVRNNEYEDQEYPGTINRK